MVLFFIQIAVGTQVREAIDLIALQIPRSQWIQNLGTSFYIHRSYSLLLLAIVGVLVVWLRRSERQDLKSLADWFFLVVVAEIILGVIMSVLWCSGMGPALAFASVYDDTWFTILPIPES